MKKLLLTLSLFALAITSLADVILRKDADPILGQIQRHTKSGVYIIDTKNEQRFVPIEEIDSIIKGNQENLEEQLPPSEIRLSSKYCKVSIYQKSSATKWNWKFLSNEDYKKYTRAELEEIERRWTAKNNDSVMYEVRIKEF